MKQDRRGTYTGTVPHAMIIYYVVVAFTGFIAVAVSILGTLKSRIATYWLLIGFYGTLTIRLAVIAVGDYLSLNVHPVSVHVFLSMRTIGNVLNAVFMCIVTLYIHRIFVEKRRRLRDLIVVGGYAVGLIWSLILFGLVAFLSDVWGMIQYFVGTRELPFTPAGGSFVVASVPHLLFGGILMYYFGSYVLADWAALPDVGPEFVGKYGISPREREVIALLNRGLSNWEIAEKLFVSLATVKTHLHSIYEKTGAKSRYELFSLSR